MTDRTEPSVIERVLRNVKRPFRHAIRHRAQVREQLHWSRVEWDIEREIERVAQGGHMVLVGPWLSEVGFEALYWIPFLRWVKTAFRLDPSRVVAVSRGGVASWYEDVASRYIDVWDEFDSAQFAARTAERGAMKQSGVHDFDREVIAAVERRVGARVDVLHPSLMFRLFSMFWSGHKPMSFVDGHTRFALHRAPSEIDPSLLPAEYVAVKLYFGLTLADTPEHRRALSSLVAGLAEQTPVVLLDTGLVVDEHIDYEFRAGRVISARPWMTPRNNLGVQTQIIAGARAFVGTCGSVAWLAPMLGVDTSALYVRPNTLHAHLAVALRMYQRMNAAQFATVDLRALDDCFGWRRDHESAGAS